MQGRQRLVACRNSCKELEKGSSSLWDRIMGCKGEPESEGAFCSNQAKTRDKTDDVRELEKKARTRIHREMKLKVCQALGFFIKYSLIYHP